MNQTTRYVRTMCKKKQQQSFRGNDLRLPSTMHHLSSAKSGHFSWEKGRKNFRIYVTRVPRSFVSLDYEDPIYFEWIF